MLTINRLDHFVLTVKDIDTTLAFYMRVLGMQKVRFGSGRYALHFGQQKINLHQAGHEFEPKAKKPVPGSADLCFVADMPISEIMAHIKQQQIDILEGPVPRTGAAGSITSIYIRDPDGNLIEISSYNVP